MKPQLVYDLPIRIFHWFFAGLFVVAFAIAKTIDDDSSTYAYHMLAGLLLCFTVILRLLWGVVGTKHSRFSSFALHPKDLMSYFRGIASGNLRKWSGHNPASSWAAIIMFVLALGLGVTGFLMANGKGDAFEDIHELLANGFLVVVLLHVAGVILHSIRHQDSIALSMFSGKKDQVPTEDVIVGVRPLIATVFIACIVMFAVYLFKNYNLQTQKLNMFGYALQLGENEEDENKSRVGSDKNNDGEEEDERDDD